MNGLQSKMEQQLCHSSNTQKQTHKQQPCTLTGVRKDGTVTWAKGGLGPQPLAEQQARAHLHENRQLQLAAVSLLVFVLAPTALNTSSLCLCKESSKGLPSVPQHQSCSPGAFRGRDSEMSK